MEFKRWNSLRLSSNQVVVVLCLCTPVCACVCRCRGGGGWEGKRKHVLKISLKEYRVTLLIILLCFIKSVVSVQFSSVQLLSHVRLFATPWITAHQASLFITNYRSSLKLMSIESVMPSSHLILCHPLLLLPPIPPSIRIFSNESTLYMRWPKYWSFSFSIIPSKEISGVIFRMDWLDLLP